ncbi:MAG: hypothetical protein M1823_004282 [Watsoniomyces obsoletus]|nr:MAG: hypothetical protein M1823_004282 [Watsoniomyces obsoletus]
MAPALVDETTQDLTNQAIAKDLVNHAKAHASNGVSNGSVDALSELNASRLRITLTNDSRTIPPPTSSQVKSQNACTDHMITATWTATEGWHDPELKPYGPFSMMPNASVLHYGTECFEGMKVFRGDDGKLRLFRPDRNCARMLISATRVALPVFPPLELEKLIKMLVAVDAEKWLPKTRPGNLLYLRPAMIGTHAALGVQRPQEALLFVIMCMFPNLDVPISAAAMTSGIINGEGPPPQHLSTTNPGLKLLASQDDIVRAWPGGFGYAKVGGNYGPTLAAQGEARSRGYDQILWLFGEEKYVTEAGASNFMVVWRTKEGRVEMVTAPLDDRMILDGVMRRSTLELARERLSGGDHCEMEPLSVVERKFSMLEMEQAILDGRMLEAFVCGTAVSTTQLSLRVPG